MLVWIWSVLHVHDAGVIVKSSPFSRLCEDEAQTTRLWQMGKTQLRRETSSQMSLGLCKPNVLDQALWALLSSWWPALYNCHMFVPTSVSLNPTRTHTHSYTYKASLAGLINSESYKEGGTCWNGETGIQTSWCPFYQVNVGTHSAVTCSMRCVVGMWDFSLFSLLFESLSSRRNGFAGLLWSPLYDSFICFSHILFRASLNERCFELGAREMAHTAFPLRLGRWHGGPQSNQ